MEVCHKADQSHKPKEFIKRKICFCLLPQKVRKLRESSNLQFFPVTPFPNLSCMCSYKFCVYSGAFPLRRTLSRSRPRLVAMANTYTSTKHPAAANILDFPTGFWGFIFVYVCICVGICHIGRQPAGMGQLNFCSWALTIFPFK